MKYRIIQIEVAVPEHAPDGEFRDYVSNSLPTFKGDCSDLIADWRYTGIERDVHAATDDGLDEGEVFNLLDRMGALQGY